MDRIVVLGTTGEAPTLSHTEQEEIIRITVDEVGGKLPVIVGTGTYATKQTVENTIRAEALGADETDCYSHAIAVTEQGLLLHFKAVASCVKMPIIVYNIQGRTGQNILTHDGKLPNCNIIGVKRVLGKCLPNYGSD